MRKLFIFICLIVFANTSVYAVDWVKTPCGSYFDKDRTIVRDNVVYTILKSYSTTQPNTIHYEAVTIDLSKKFINFTSSQSVEESSGKALTPIMKENSFYYASDYEGITKEIEFFRKMYGVK